MASATGPDPFVGNPKKGRRSLPGASAHLLVQSNDPHSAVRPPWRTRRPGTFQRAEGTSDARAEELVARWVDAVGGVEARWPLQTSRYTLG